MAKSKAQVQFEADTSGFTSEIKEADQSLKTLRKELSLNSAELKENGDNVDLLTDRKKILQNELEQSANKVEALRKKLETAKQTFGENSKEVYDLKNKLLDAKTSFQNIQNEVTQTDSKLKNLESGLDDVEQEMKQVGSASEDLTEGFTVMKGAVAELVAEGIEELSQELKDLAVDSDTAYTNFQAQTGLTSEEMGELENAIEDVYALNLGENLNEVANAMAQVKQQTKETDPAKLREMTSNALSLKETFDYDVAESMRAVNSLMNQFGVSGDEAFNLLVQGAQNGLNANGDMLDVINEYSVQFKNAGYSADNMFNMLVNGAKSGTWSIDKMGDSFKEFNIRMSDGTVVEALEEQGIVIDNLAERYGNGGESAQEVMTEVIQAIMSVENENERYKLGVEAFGTTWEDLGEDAIVAMMNTEGSIDSTKQSMEEINQLRMDSITNQISSIGRSIQQDFLIPIAEDLLPIVKDGIEWISENLNWLLPIVVAVGVAISTYFVASKIIAFIGMIKTLIELVKSGTTVMTALNTVMNLNPIALIVVGIVALIAVFAILWTKCEGFRMFWINLWENVKSVAISLYDALKEMFTALWQSIQSIFETIKLSVCAVWEIIKTFVSETVDNIKNTVITVWENIKDTVATVLESIRDTTTDIWEGIKNAISTVIDGVKTFVTTSFDFIKDHIVTPLQTAYENVKSIFENIYDTISEKITSAKDKVKDVIDKIKGFFDFKFSWPSIPMPHFSISPSGWKIGDLLKGSIPSLGISWYKEGGIFTKATIIDTATGFKGVGEAGAEAVLPLEKLENWIYHGFNTIASSSYNNEKIDKLIELTEGILNKSSDTYLNGRKVSESLAESSDEVSGRRYNIKERGVLI